MHIHRLFDHNPPTRGVARFPAKIYLAGSETERRCRGTTLYTPAPRWYIYIINIHENRGGVISFYRTIPSRANFASGRIYRFSRDSCRARGFWIISNKYISHLYNIYCIIRCKTLARGRGGNKTMSHAYKLCSASRRREQRAVNIFRHDEWGWVYAGVSEYHVTKCMQ